MSALPHLIPGDQADLRFQLAGFPGTPGLDKFWKQACLLRFFTMLSLGQDFP